MGENEGGDPDEAVGFELMGKNGRNVGAGLISSPEALSLSPISLNWSSSSTLSLSSPSSDLTSSLQSTIPLSVEVSMGLLCSSLCSSPFQTLSITSSEGALSSALGLKLAPELVTAVKAEEPPFDESDGKSGGSGDPAAEPLLAEQVGDTRDEEWIERGGGKNDGNRPGCFSWNPAAATTAV